MRRLVLLLVALCHVTVLQGQQIESASVKPAGPESKDIFLPQQGRFVGGNVRVERLIVEAYGIFTFQLAGGPEWIRSERFDIVATIRPEPDGRPRVWGAALMRQLLEDRFRLKVRRESQARPIYVLSRIDPNRLGPQLVPSANPCDRARTDVPPCSSRFRQDLIEAVGMPFGALPVNLIGTIGRPIVDRTNLQGRFDVTLKWTPDLPAGAEPAGGERVSLFTALQEQLGLRLQPDTGPVDVVVIESVSRPTPD